MRSGFYEDTDVFAEDFATAFAAVMINGVLAGLDENALKVTAAGGMMAAIAPGRCWIEGHYGVTDSSELLTLSLSDGSLDRIDRVVIRNDMGSGKMSPRVIEGVPSSAPVPPDIVRDGTFYDICLATIKVPAGALEILPEHITDNRSDSGVCGWSTSRSSEKLILDGKIDKTDLLDTVTGVQYRFGIENGVPYIEITE